MTNDENLRKALAPKAQAFVFSFPMQAPVTTPQALARACFPFPVLFPVPVPVPVLFPFPFPVSVPVPVPVPFPALSALFAAAGPAHSPR
jgi:hypothetical protein